MELQHYFEPFKGQVAKLSGFAPGEALGQQVAFFKGESDWFGLEGIKVVVLGLDQQADLLRYHLYALRGFEQTAWLGDAGNLKGRSLNDRYRALRDALSWFRKRGQVVLLLGGSQDYTPAILKGMADAQMQPRVNLAVADHRFDLEPGAPDLSPQGWLSYLLQEEAKLLGELSILGWQRYLVSPWQESFLTQEYAHLLRLGDLRGKGFDEVEVVLRGSDFLGVDMGVVKGQPLFPGTVAPNGLEPHEACRMFWYAGMSPRLSVSALFALPEGQANEALLGAEVVWHFFDGYLGRQPDYPEEESGRYKKYLVPLEALDEPLCFVRNLQNDRWWMQTGVQAEDVYLPCSRSDFRLALRNMLPERLWRFLMRRDEIRQAGL